MIQRIYADFNGIIASPKTPGRQAVVLDTMGSLRSLSNAGIQLHEGLPLVVYDEDGDDQDLEAHGTALYESPSPTGGKGWWVIEFDEVGVQRVPAGDRPSLKEFNCLSCRQSLIPVIESCGLEIGDVCPNCNTPIHAAIAPPNDR